MTKAERHKEYMREIWYPRNRAKHKARVRGIQLRHRKENQAYIRTIKIQCSRCPETHPATLDFHHKNPRRKIATVSFMVLNGWSLDRVKKEVEKCEIMCANCHRKEHWKE